ncbi:type II toxin-antitoxin system VapC family toxin [Amycolatopsis sp. RM579]|uniref:Type II toxin-antitoxin system VapC family toxin n=2 Tax=Amycolatopsis pithecellobii TaxID=664692 RepID=A0A6N7YZK1_9PSEU|nr:type II toxin-antitoxin system VapC family toxin [Amycolatopsis pithecellobii]
MFKRDLPAWLAARLVGYRPAITFVTLGELNKWMHLRSWALPRRERLEKWIQPLPVFPGTLKVARLWGEMSAYAQRRGRPRPQNDTWIAACCLAFEVPLATLNVKDYEDFAEYEGLELLVP